MSCRTQKAACWDKLPRSSSLPHTLALCINKAMHIISLLTLIIYLACHILAAYFLLKKIGVSRKLIYRASLFGLTFVFLQLIVPTGFALINIEYWFIVGVFIGLVLSYLYVRHVVKLIWYKNIAIVIFLPVAAGICSMPFMYLLYFANA